MIRISPIAVRLSFYYAALLSVTGIQLPYWPLYLASKGLNAPEIGQILAASYLIKIVTNPLVGMAADRRGARRGPLILLAFVSLVATAVFPLADGFLSVLIVTLVSSAAYTAMLPLGDSLTMQCTISHRLDYGRIRLWGSISFIVVASLAGQQLTSAPRSAILWASLAGLLANLASTFYLPDLRSEPAKGKAVSLRPLLASRPFQLFLACCSLGQASHMIYYGFATLHWRAAGLSGTIIGALWAEGVIAEVVFFALGARLVTRFGPVALMIVSGLAGVLRWSVLATTTDPIILACVQGLHALTFGAGHLGAMHFISRSTPTGLSARAQGIYSAVVTGVVSGLAMLGSGTLYHYLNGEAFFVMCLMSLMAVLLAFALKRQWSGGMLVAAPSLSEKCDGA
ncbi:MFS transporter [Telmatospirillum sp.]|uniref:MFS transporter n=1 Tax=Telmatospirillum sp. TaxID=2079197 RepID=UPI00283F40FD|nr:MFS transporter [Telmatospirillum sp.]MDR3440056.1 MFS transporter [Telmatospirillum sp.]